MVRWTDNDELARRLIAEGHHWEHVVAGLLAAAGLHVEVQEQTIRKDVSEALAGKYAKTVDLLVDGFRTQVKSRNIKTWRDPVFLCSERSWRHVGDITDIWICILRHNKQMLCTSGETAREHGKWQRTWDNTRGIRSLRVRCLDLKHWTTMEEMVAWVKAR